MMLSARAKKMCVGICVFNASYERHHTGFKRYARTAAGVKTDNAYCGKVTGNRIIIQKLAVLCRNQRRIK